MDRQSPINLIDKRVKAAVLPDPMVAIFSDLSLSAIADLPIRSHLPEIRNVLNRKLLGRGVGRKRGVSEKKSGPNRRSAGVHHYSFISPLPEKVSNSLPLIAGDYGEFDRAGFHCGFSDENATFSQYYLPWPVNVTNHRAR